ncbi:MAG: histidine kinase [Bacteroidia bacterium]|nr:histidine kinase [Bacteroidia bacterium]
MQTINHVRGTRQGLQVVCWGLIWMIFPLMAGDPGMLPGLISRGAMFAAGCALLVAINVWVLCPYLYFRRAYGWYALACIALLVVAGIVTRVLEPPPVPPPDMPAGPPIRRPAYFPLLIFPPYLMSLIGSTIVEVTFFVIEREREAITLRSEKLETEMRFMRWQTNPHFLFNALNNIYALSLMKSDAAPSHILRLSDMLRYMLYEGNGERVLLSREVAYLKNYLDFQQLKSREGFNVQADIGPVPGDPYIAPMLLIPFVENAFKHSHIESRAGSWIRISLRIEGTQLQFEVANHKPEVPYVQDAQAGIGLTNVRRLLAYSYPGRHQLEVSPAADTFTIRLTLDLA